MFVLFFVLSLCTHHITAAAAKPAGFTTMNPLEKQLGFDGFSAEKEFTTSPARCPEGEEKTFGLGLYYMQELLKEKKTDNGTEVAESLTPILLYETLAYLQITALAGHYDSIIIYAGLILTHLDTVGIETIETTADSALIQAFALLNRVVAGGRYPVIADALEAIRRASTADGIVIPERARIGLLTEATRAFNRHEKEIVAPPRPGKMQKPNSFCTVM